MSQLAWLVHDPEEHDTVNRILAALKQGEARDELGLGAIRDSLADRLFPGTSTIQTRLRYFLIVPWCYRALENKGVRAPEFGRQVAALERRLIPILNDGEAWGVFGRVAGQDIKRLPSSVYWNGLEQWGVRKVRISQGAYHRTVDRFLDRRGKVQQTEDGESIATGGSTIWHPSLPAAPAGFPDGLDFRLTEDEADFLIARMRDKASGTMLAWLAQAPHLVNDVQSARFPWTLSCYASLPADTRELLEHARLVSEVVQGAGQLYNLLLARIDDPAGSPRLAGIETDRLAGLTDWRALLASRFDAVAQWDHERLKQLCRAAPGHNVTEHAWAFLRAWTDRVVETRGQVEDDTEACKLVRKREIRLKKGRSRSRFKNATMRAQWSGAAGIGRLEFRWGAVRALLADLYATTADEVAA